MRALLLALLLALAAPAGAQISGGAVSVPGWVFLGTQVASNSATLDACPTCGAAVTFDSTYDAYVIVVSDLIAATADLQLRVSEDSGSTWKAGATDYQWGLGLITSAGGVTPQSSGAGQAQIVVMQSCDSVAGKTCDAQIVMFKPSSATSNKNFQIDSMRYNAGTQRMYGMGSYIGTANAINGVRLLMSTGNVVSGRVTYYGMRKS